MSKGNWLGILLIFLVFVGIVLIDASAKRPIDWSESYLFKDKIPFGAYVFREELPNILSGTRTFKEHGDSFYELFGERDSTEDFDNVSLIDIYAYQGIYDENIDALLDFVAQGGEVFLSGKSFTPKFLDTLGLYVEELDYNKFTPTPRTVFYTLGADTSRLQLDKVNNYPIFSLLNPKTTTILGYLNCKGRAMPNFVKVDIGRGAIYLHLLPALFGNYYMLREDSYHFMSKTVNVLQNKKVWLYDYGYNWEQPQTPLRVILQKPGFVQAWYLMLVGLILLMVFKSKREQRAVPVILPEPNKSKEFAQTIGNLYYENGSPGNIIQKKIEYFLFDIRNNYQLDTLNLKDERFIKQLSTKSNVDQEETKELIKLVLRYKDNKNASLADVKIVNQKIEDFKQKANLI